MRFLTSAYWKLALSITWFFTENFSLASDMINRFPNWKWMKIQNSWEILMFLIRAGCFSGKRVFYWKKYTKLFHLIVPCSVLHISGNWHGKNYFHRGNMRTCHILGLWCLWWLILHNLTSNGTFQQLFINLGRYSIMSDKNRKICL